MSNKRPREAVTSPAPAKGFGTGDGRSEKAAEICSEWLAHNAEQETLTRRWQELESHLIHRHDWFRLSQPERNAMPEAAELKAMEDHLEALCGSKMRLLCELPGIAATTAEGVTLKLRVAIASVFPDENLEAHNLLRSILEDLQAMLGTRAG